MKRKREKARADPVLSRKPDPPLANKGAGGRVGVGSSIGSYVRKIAALEKVTDKDVDPREALLKYAKAAAENPYWVAPAYNRYGRPSHSMHATGYLVMYLDRDWASYALKANVID